MTMHRAAVAEIAERILDRCKLARPGKPPTDRDLADVMGTDKSVVSRYRSGARQLPLDELVALVAEYGPEAALGPLAALGGAEVRPVAAAAARDGASPVAGALRAVGEVAGCAQQVEAALRDGRLCDDEADDLLRRHDQAQASLHQTLRAILAQRVTRRSA